MHSFKRFAANYVFKSPTGLRLPTGESDGESGMEREGCREREGEGGHRTLPLDTSPTSSPRGRFWLSAFQPQP